MEMTREQKRLVFVAGLILLFLFRLGFGLCTDFRAGVGDERQVYLIGLKFYTTGAWPFFGPDVTGSIQIPGALQGLAAGLPFYVLPAPEAPYVFVNLLSFAALCFFAWYCTKRLPGVPRWFIWLWLLTAPWALNLSTQVVNPSYVLPGGILFFVAALETYPRLSKDLVPRRAANFLMGAALFWVMQFHLSWPILVSYALASFYFQYREGGRGFLAGAAWFACGACVTGVFIAPTLVAYGLSAGLGGAEEAARLNPQNMLRQLNVVEGVLGRFLSFASFELPRFIGNNTAARVAFVKENPWLAPFVVFLAAVGIFQAVTLLALWFRREHRREDWKALKYLTLWTVVLLYVSFLFSVKAPLSHTFYLTFPLSMLYGLYCWDEYLARPFWRRLAAVVIVCGIVFHLGLAAHNYSHVSLYLEREKIGDAIEGMNYHLLDERRPGARY